MTNLIVISSSKGGVGKTSAAVTIAHALARQSYRTLLVDLDQQSHCAISLGLDPEPGLFEWLCGAPLENHLRVTGRANLSLLPGDSHTRLIERLSATDPGLERRFWGMVAWTDYDAIVIDTPPSGLLQELALRIAHSIVIPCRCELLGTDGVVATMAMVRQLHIDDSKVVVLPTMYDRRLTEHSYQVNVLRQEYGSKVVLPVPSRIAVAEATAMGQTIFESGDSALGEVRNAYEQLLTAIHLRAAVRQNGGVG